MLRRSSLLLALQFILALPPCLHAAAAAEPHAGLMSAALGERGGAGATLFERLTDPKRTGIDFVSPVDLQHRQSFLYHSGTATGGVAIGDVDGDGKPDIFLVSGPRANRLYRQTGDLRFEDITASAGPLDGGDAWGGGAAMADVDNDGDLDIYVCNYDAPNQLFINLGAGKKGEPVVFGDRAKAFGLDLVDASHSAYFADYDNDGDLDVYLLTNRYDDPGGFNPTMPVTNKDGRVELKPGAEKFYSLWRLDENNWGTEPSGTPDRLLRNDGGKFTDVSAAAGIAGRGDGLSATWFDFDNDGLLDLWVGNDFLSEDRLYRNKGDGTFTDVIADAVPHTCWFSMGADFADFNNDGWLDFFLADMSATTHLKTRTTGAMSPLEFKRAAAAPPPQVSHNCLFLNTGTGRFLEIANALGLASTDWSWAVKCADFDNDGWQDIYVNNGVVRQMNDADMKVPQEMLLGKRLWDFYKEGPLRKEEHRAFRNKGGLQFEEAGKAWGLDSTAVSYGCAAADLDRDGDLDLVEVNLEENVAIYRNGSAGGHRALIALMGTRSNRQGLGARVTIKTAAGMQTRLLSPTTGYQSHNEALLHFGLGDAAVIDELIVRWPSGSEQRFAKLAADHFFTITEPVAGAAPAAAPPVGPMFAPFDALSASKHEDPPFDDHGKQPLLPHGLSNLGPGLAWADADGDGDFDYYVAKGAGQVGEVRFNDGKGRFIARFSAAFRADKAFEDFAPLFLDADGDGDQDLFVGGGSYEFEIDDPEQQDRLYLNDGKGDFTRAADALPPDGMPAGAVCAADFDRDGDLDLFVGDRVVPGDFPMPADGRLLRNESAGGKARFIDATKEVAPALTGTGLVTSALWTDANNDGWLDLLVAHEWGPVKLFLNRAGQLAPAASAGDLAEKLGWWNALAAADIDHDGDMDYLATNLGWNTRYPRPSAAEPRLLYYGEFSDSDERKLLELQRDGGALFPWRGRNAMANAIPLLKDKFPTHRAFASATLEQLFPAAKIEAAVKFKATTFDTGIFRNDGNGANGVPTFTFQPLPAAAQFAPGFGAVLSDLDGDGHADIYLVHNLRSVHFEDRRFDGGASQLLLGDGRGHFTAVGPARSGLVELGDAKACTLADLDGDAWPDLALSINNGPLRAFANRPAAGRAMLRVELPASAAGARVTVSGKGFAAQTAELSAGGGYASQSPPALSFGLGDRPPAGTIRVRWPGGQETEQAFSENQIQIKPPQ